MSGYSPLLCGKCRAPVKLAIDASWRATVACPSCGESDTFDNAANEAGAYLADSRRREIARRIGATLPDAPPRSFRFVRDDPPQETVVE
jgi:RNA polymerase subunit RPABC4/transcription elongation factor Spt4